MGQGLSEWEQTSEPLLRLRLCDGQSPFLWCKASTNGAVLIGYVKFTEGTSSISEVGHHKTWSNKLKITFLQWILVFFSHYRRLFHLLMGGSYGGVIFHKNCGSFRVPQIIGSGQQVIVVGMSPPTINRRWFTIEFTSVVTNWYLQSKFDSSKMNRQERKWCPLPLGSDGFRSLPPSLGIWKFQKVESQQDS